MVEDTRTELKQTSIERYHRRGFHYITTTLGYHHNQLEPSKPGFFSLNRPPSTWYHIMFHGQAEWNIETRIRRSIEAIQKEHGLGGIFQVLLWVTSPKLSRNHTGFRQEVVKVVYSMLGRENYLVRFQDCGKELNEAQCGSAHLGEFPFIIDAECFGVYQILTGGFGCISYGEGLSRLGVQELGDED